MSLIPPRVRMTALVATVALAVGLCLGLLVEPERAPQQRPMAPAASETGRGEPYLETRLYFGTGRHNGHPPITEKEFLRFVADHITPRFPDGLTIQEGRGQWRDKEGDINREKSYQLIVLYPLTEARERDADIEQIRDLYTTTYELESVLRSDAPTRADF